MKIILCSILFAFGSCSFDPKTFDWSVVKPLTQTKAFGEFFSNLNFEPNERIKSFGSRLGRIIRGDIASPYDFPFQVGLLLSYTNEQSWCSGSLITKKSVLTAGSCLVGSPIVTVLLGASEVLETKQYIYADKLKIHESFKKNLDNDIGILILSYEAQLSACVGIVRLPNLNQISESFLNKASTVAGWLVELHLMYIKEEIKIYSIRGATGNSNDPLPTPFLKYTTAKVISHTTCLLRYPLYISSTNICTNVPSGTPCDGDEGGGLTILENDNIRTQIGIFSYQYSLGCDRGWPGLKRKFEIVNKNVIESIFSCFHQSDIIFGELCGLLIVLGLRTFVVTEMLLQNYKLKFFFQTWIQINAE